MAQEKELQEQVENMDITVSHTMGYDSYQREKTFDSISLKGDVYQSNDIRLVMVYKELVTTYLKLGTYRTLKEQLLLEDKAIIDKGDGSKTKTVDEANEFGYENRKAGVAISLDRLGEELDELDTELSEEVDTLLLKKANNLLDIIGKQFFAQ